jgi:hypothetical protein
MSILPSAASGGKRSTPVAGPTVWAELTALAERAEAAARQARAALAIPDRAAAEFARDEAAGEFWAFRRGLGDLFVLLLRYGLEYHPDALAAYLSDALASELGPLAEAVVRLEGRR